MNITEISLKYQQADFSSMQEALHATTKWCLLKRQGLFNIQKSINIMSILIHLKMKTRYLYVEKNFIKANILIYISLYIANRKYSDVYMEQEYKETSLIFW